LAAGDSAACEKKANNQSSKNWEKIA